jgi:hypothetical protein
MKFCITLLVLSVLQDVYIIIKHKLMKLENFYSCLDLTLGKVQLYAKQSWRMFWLHIPKYRISIPCISLILFRTEARVLVCLKISLKQATRLNYLKYKWLKRVLWFLIFIDISMPTLDYIVIPATFSRVGRFNTRIKMLTIWVS